MLSVHSFVSRGYHNIILFVTENHVLNLLFISNAE